MRIHIQRVSEARVEVNGREIGCIGKGLLLLVAARKGDTEEQLPKLAEKCMNLRIFSDANGKMNLSVQDVGGSLLVVSNFTLYGDCRKGNRPNFMDAAPGPEAEKLYNRFVEILRQGSVPVATGEFGAMMDVHLTNDGPVTVMLEA
jgi:D-tyrosyl-tRNA(Tyr) deacylase